jgi:hypothetical protein
VPRIVGNMSLTAEDGVPSDAHTRSLVEVPFQL